MPSQPTTTFSWHITSMERETADGFVFLAQYTVDAADGVYTAGAAGSMDFQRCDEDLIPYADLTEEIVVGWVQDKLGEETVANIETTLQAHLDEKHSPTRASGLPWTA